MNDDKKIPAQTETSKPRKKFNTKKLKYGGLSVLITVIVVAVVVLLNVVVGVLSDRTGLDIDLTSEQLYGISAQTEDYLKKVTQRIEILVTTNEVELSDSASVYANYYKQAYEVMRKYAQANPLITLRFVDVNKNPQELTRFATVYQGTIPAGSVVMSVLDEAGNPLRVRVLSISADLFNMEIDYNTYQQYIASSKAEQALTTAMMYITDVDPKHAYIMFTESAEAASTLNIQTMLLNNGYETDIWNSSEEALPEDCDLLVVNNPLNDFDEATVNQLYNYLENNGNYGKNLVYLANNAQRATPNINNFLKEWGLSPKQGAFVGELNEQNILSSNSTLYFKMDITENDYTKGISNLELPIATYAPVPIDILFETQDNVNVVPLIYSDETAYLYTEEFAAAFEADPNTAPIQDEYCIAAISNKFTFDDQSKMILSNILIFGSSDMLDSSFTGLSYYSNAEYFISAVNTMTGKTAGIVVQPKVDSTGSFEVTAANFNTMLIVFMILIPLAVLLTGVVVLLRRRHK
jgi:hypothetical protein